MCWEYVDTFRAGFVTRYLAEVGMSAQHQRALWPQVDLGSQLASYLEWELLLPSLEALNYLNKSANGHRPPALLRAYALARFGCLQQRMEERASEFLHRLDLRLLEEAVL